MGMYDTIHCEMPLPDNLYALDRFQTKYFDQVFAPYYIDPTGNFWLKLSDGTQKRIAYSGTFEMHDYVHYEGGGGVMYRYELESMEGTIVAVKLLSPTQ